MNVSQKLFFTLTHALTVMTLSGCAGLIPPPGSLDKPIDQIAQAPVICPYVKNNSMLFPGYVTQRGLSGQTAIFEFKNLDGNAISRQYTQITSGPGYWLQSYTMPFGGGYVNVPRQEVHDTITSTGIAGQDNNPMAAAAFTMIAASCTNQHTKQDTNQGLVVEPTGKTHYNLGANIGETDIRSGNGVNIPTGITYTTELIPPSQYMPTVMGISIVAKIKLNTPTSPEFVITSDHMIYMDVTNVQSTTTADLNNFGYQIPGSSPSFFNPYGPHSRYAFVTPKSVTEKIVEEIRDTLTAVQHATQPPPRWGMPSLGNNYHLHIQP